MQFLIDSSKYFILSILSCTFLVFYGANTNATSWGSIDNYYHNSHTSGPYGAAASDVSDKTIWSTIGAAFGLDHKAQSPEVQKAIRQLLADKKKLYEILESSEPYIYFIYQQTQNRGLPAELALIPAIESEFNPNDHSNKGATGLWQLMPGTAHELGVKVKSNYDGRRNVIASTRAALAYFRDLGALYKGNWYLAIAAYNCGQATVESALRRAGSRNFWNLKLPRETQLYLPKLLAVAAIVQNPEKYNVQLPHIHDEPYFSAVTVNKPVNLNQVAESTGISISSLTTLNPDYKHGTAPSKDKDAYTFLVPVKDVPAVQARYSAQI